MIDFKVHHVGPGQNNDYVITVSVTSLVLATSKRVQILDRLCVCVFSSEIEEYFCILKEIWRDIELLNRFIVGNDCVNLKEENETKCHQRTVRYSRFS